MNIKNKPSGRVVCAGALIVLLGLCAWKAGQQGISNFYVQSAQQEVQLWSSPGRKFQGNEGLRVTQYLAKSLEHSANNPWALEVRGTLQLRGMGALSDPRLAVAAARSANADFRAALAQRPTSPFSWANLALTKLYLYEQDDELTRALGHAGELGPWEPEIQQMVVFVGLSIWNRLNTAQQDAVFQTMWRGAQRNPLKIAEIAKSFSRIDLYCSLSYSGSESREACNSNTKSGNSIRNKAQQLQ